MKTLLLSLFLISFQNTSILNYFAKANVDEIVAQMAEDVIITLEKDMDFYNPDKAAVVLNDFFTAHPPKSAERLFDDARDMVVANLKTTNGSYRLSITYDDGKIVEITILRN